MKKFLKKAVVLSLVTAVLFSAACNRGGTSSSGSGQTVAIDLLLLGTTPTNGRHAAALEEINKLTGPRIGATLKTRYIEWADWQNQYQLALASQDPTLDLVITATDWLYAWEISRRGGFYALTPELLQANAPITWREVTPSHWDVCTADGTIWFIPEDQFSQYTNHGIYWRGDWARAGGLNSVDRFEDLETYFDIVKANHPEAYPWDVGGAEYADLSLFTGYIQGKRPIQGIIGISPGLFQYNINDPYTVVSWQMDGNEMVEAARLFHRWGQKGFWRDDVLNYRAETRNLMYEGLSGADAHHTMTYLGTRYEMDLQQPGSELQMFTYGIELKNVNKDLLTHGAMAINAASRNVEKALQMYDLLRNDKEIYQLYNFGIAGRDYVVVSGNVVTRPPDFNVYTDGLEANFWGGRMDKYEFEWDTWWTGRNAFLDNLNTFAMDYPLEKFAFDNSRVSAELAALSDVYSTYAPAIHFGKTPDPDRAVADFRAALQRAGFDRVKEEVQSQLNAFRGR